MKRLKLLVLSGALVAGATFYMGNKDSVDSFVKSTKAYREVSVTEERASHELYRIYHRDVYRSVEAEFNEKLRDDGNVVFLKIGAPWCGPCKGLESYLYGNENARGISQDYTSVRFEQIELDGEGDMTTPRNSAIIDVMEKRGMLDGDLDIPRAFIIRHNAIEYCMVGYRTGGIMRACGSDQKVSIKEKIKIVAN